MDDKLFPSVTTKLMDEEIKVEAKRRARLSDVAHKIEDILLKEDITFGDFLEVVGMFTSRANSVFEKTKLKTIQEKYEI